MIFCNDRKEYEVIDNDGNVVDTFGNGENARARCVELGLDPREVNWQELNRIRQESGVTPKEWVDIEKIGKKKKEKKHF